MSSKVETKKTNEIPNTKYFNSHKCNATFTQSMYDINCGPLRKYALSWTAVNMDDTRALRMYSSYAALSAEKYRQHKYYPYSIHPFSKLRYWLETLFAYSMFVSNLLVALYFSQPNINTWDYYNIAIVAIDFKYILIIITNFFTGYVDRRSIDSLVVLDLKKIICEYSTTWLLVDLLTCASLVSKLIGLNDTNLILIFETMRILRMPVMYNYIYNTMTALRAGLVTKTLMGYAISVYSYITWNIYFQFIVEYLTEGSYTPLQPRNCSWLTVTDLWNATRVERFIYALQRSVCMLRQSTNSEVIKYGTCHEIFYMIAWFIARILLMHHALKCIIILFGSESADAKYLTMIRQIQSYMDLCKFPLRLRNKVLKYYAILNQSHYFAASRMLERTSGQLKEDIMVYTGRQLVSDIPFLKQLPRPLLLQIRHRLKVVIFIAGDIIVKVNTIGDCLYFIHKGTVAIYSESGKEVYHLEDGEFFGTIALVMKYKLRRASVVAVTNCELFKLDRSDYEEFIASYPTVYEEFKKICAARLERIKILDEHHRNELRMMDKQKERRKKK